MLTLSNRGRDDRRAARALCHRAWSAPVRAEQHQRADRGCAVHHQPRAGPVKPKTIGQKEYVDADAEAIPSPSAWALPAPARRIWRWRRRWPAFRDKQVNRIILTRPAVEAGERLGFLPGDLQSEGGPVPAARCTTPCLICWGRRPTRSIWSGATSRWRPWPICAGGRWTTASSFWTRPRTPAGSR